MVQLASIGTLLARPLLLPGDLACDALGRGRADNRDLVRMLVNSLAWTLVGIVVVAISV
jgi:hypothetical protein